MSELPTDEQIDAEILRSLGPMYTMADDRSGFSPAAMRDSWRVGYRMHADATATHLPLLERLLDYAVYVSQVAQSERRKAAARDDVLLAEAMIKGLRSASSGETQR